MVARSAGSRYMDKGEVGLDLVDRVSSLRGRMVEKRKDLKITQAKMARYLGVSRVHLNVLERGGKDGGVVMNWGYFLAYLEELGWELDVTEKS